MEQIVVQKKPVSKKILIFATVIVIAAAGIFYGMSQKNKGLEFDENATIGTLPGIDMEQRKAEMQKQLDDSMIAFSVNTSPTLASGTSEGNFMIENPQQNEKLIVAEIYLDNTESENGTGELLYKSKFIKPGSYIENLKLEKVLSAGTYNATVYFKAYNIDNQSFIGQTGAAIKITVQS